MLRVAPAPELQPHSNEKDPLMLELSASQLPPAAPTRVRASSRPAGEPALQMVWTRVRNSAGHTHLACSWSR